MTHYSNIVSRFTYWITHLRWPTIIAPTMCRLFARIFGVNLDEVERPLQEYRCFDAFFTRKLKPGCRTIDDVDIVSPVDGAVLAQGQINRNALFQAKGLTYTLENLIPDIDTTPFLNGQFMTIYLSPKDCHRIFSPIDGDIIITQHVPGVLWPVREPYISEKKNLYTVNERLTTVLNTICGQVAVVKVGAFNVGTMTAAYDDTFLTNRPGQALDTKQHTAPIPLLKGGHLGTFHLGSTVILLFEPKAPHLKSFEPHTPIQIGQALI